MTAKKSGKQPSGETGNGSKGKIRRQQIIDTVRRTLIEVGASGLKLREVAEQMGMTHGNLQYYFPTKNDLLMAIFDQAVEKYTEGVKVAVAETSTRKGRLHSIIDAGIAELKTPETALWRTMISLVDHNPDMAAILKKENDLYEQVVAEELKIISPNLSVQRRRHMARLIHAVLDGLAVQFSYEDPESPEMRALISEIKIALFAILETDQDN